MLNQIIASFIPLRAFAWQFADVFLQAVPHDLTASFCKTLICIFFIDPEFAFVFVVIQKKISE